MNNTKDISLIDLDKERAEFESRRVDEFNNVEFEKNKYWDIGHYKAKTNSIDDLEEANELSYSWFAWVERAVLAQAEINKLKKEIAYLNNARKDSNGHILSLNQKVEKLEIENKTMEHNNVWLNKQYAGLESKLTDYESPDYVLVTRKP